jgi:MFS transporter, UMF1 family
MVGSHRKNLLLMFAGVGSVAGMLFPAVGTGGAMWAGLLAIIGNVCPSRVVLTKVAFGASFVCLNAFLPLLVRNHPSITHAEDTSTQENEYTAVSQEEPPSTEEIDISPPATQQSLLLSTRISTQGIAIGYTSGMLLQLATIPLVILTGSTTKSLQLAVLVSGLWWALFSLPAALWMRPRPGPPLPAAKSTGAVRRTLEYILYGWKVIFATVLKASKLKDVMFFLGAWFLLSDGYTTITSTAILFAKTTLGIGPAGLALIGILATAGGICGSILWPRVITPRVKFLRKSPHRTILFILTLSLAIPLYGLMGFIPLFKRIGFGGLVNKNEIFVVGFLFGFLYGGMQGYCRSFFAELIPRGLEANMFALYAVTDKGSSAVGPAVVGLITDVTHEIRWAFAFLGIMIALSLPLMAKIDVVRGKRDAETWTRERRVMEVEEE